MNNKGIDLFINYLDKIKKEMEGEIFIESIQPQVLAIPPMIEEAKKSILPDIMEEYQEFFASCVEFYNNCRTNDFLVQNLQKAYDASCVLKDCLVDITEKMEKQIGHCPCCDSDVKYLPLSPYYAEMNKKYGREYHGEDETLNREKYTCPRCGSSDRDRLIISFLKKVELSTSKEGTRVLQIAPSPTIDQWIRQWCPTVEYDTTDMMMDNVTFKSDIQDMNMVADDSYDVVICSHVLEHVKDDDKAMAEMKRIVKPDGMVVFLVPIELEREEIDEAWGLSEEENWRRFGQNDHCRAYSKNGLIKRLEKHFFVRQLGKNYFGEEVFNACGLSDTSTLYILTKSVDTALNKGWTPVINSELCENGPVVSVIMPCYNHEKYVRRAIESVIKQSYRNIEFIVCDDGSSDKTPEIMREYAHYYTKAFYFDENLRGRIPFLAEQATGKYVALMHSDDVWDENKLAVQVDYLERHGGICLTWADYISDDGVVAGNPIFYKKNRSSNEWLRYLWLNGNCFCNPSCVMDRELFLRTQRHGEGCKQLPDYFKWIDYIMDNEIHIVPLPLTKMGVHYSGATLNESAPTPENNLRTMLEDGVVWLYVFEDMPDDKFKEVFCDFFRRKEASTKEELMCEKYFLLRDSDSFVRQTSAIYYMLKHHLELKDCLKEKYGLIKADFVNDEVQKGFMAFFKQE